MSSVARSIERRIIRHLMGLAEVGAVAHVPRNKRRAPLNTMRITALVTGLGGEPWAPVTKVQRETDRKLRNRRKARSKRARRHVQDARREHVRELSRHERRRRGERARFHRRNPPDLTPAVAAVSL